VSQPIEFVSERYRYAVRLPTGWFVRDEGAGNWYPERDLNYVGGGTDSFELDYEGRGTVDDFPGVTYGLYVSSAPAAAGTTLEEWTEILAETMHRDSSCQGAPDQEQITAGGEPAILLFYDRSDCTHDHHIFIVSVLHGDSGYSIMWLARRGEQDARRGDFEEILESFRFVDPTPSPEASGVGAAAEQACPAGDSHADCMLAVRGASISGDPFAICVWSDGRWEISTPQPSDAVGATCGSDSRGRIAAIIDP
jgi:hypothetical protein